MFQVQQLLRLTLVAYCLLSYRNLSSECITKPCGKCHGRLLNGLGIQVEHNNNLNNLQSIIPNGITPIIPEIYYKARTIYSRDWRSLNTVLNSYEIPLGTLVRWYVGLSRTDALTYSHTKLNHVTRLALVPWFDLFHPVYQFLQVLPQ